MYPIDKLRKQGLPVSRVFIEIGWKKINKRNEATKCTKDPCGGFISHLTVSSAHNSPAFIVTVLESLHEELSSGKISKMRRFGRALQYNLENARIVLKIEMRDKFKCKSLLRKKSELVARWQQDCI
jgi:hypothetical protein